MKLSRLFSQLFLGIGMSLAVAGTALSADFSKLVILHTNDSHGFDKRDDEVIGMATISQMKKDLKKKGYDVLLLDAGDAIQDNNLVNISKGRTAIEFMNAAKYDAGTIGNHEFDYGQDILLRRVREAKFPILSASVMVEATGKTLVPAAKMLNTKHSGRVAIIGLTTPNSQSSSNPKNTRGLKFLEKEELYQAVQTQVDAMKSQGADLVIVLGHMGSEPNSMGNRAEDVIEHVKGIDLFVDGHDHRIKNKVINGTLLVETGCHIKNIGRLTFEDGKWREAMLPFNADYPEDRKVVKLVEKADRLIQRHLGKRIGTSKVTLDGTRYPGVRTLEMPLGDFCADALLWQAQQATAVKGPKPDAALCNGGSLRKTLKKGDVTRADILNTVPYDNQIYLMTVTGGKLLELMETATSTLPYPMGSIPQVAGIRYTVDTKVPFEKGDRYPSSTYHAPAKPGSRVTIQEINGKPFSTDAHYTVAVAEFIIYGGSAYGAMNLPEGIINTQSIGYSDAKSVENYLRTNLHGVIGEEYAAPKDRITIIK